ncbi:THxN family PEP-CTERM protein [Oryzisolibacter sp. LB2S]|uniref:THxN family PEP-CTERM protein n=1 Tax=Alicycliphilus soli TaxID=3228789 RepID=UPI0034588989
MKPLSKVALAAGALTLSAFASADPVNNWNVHSAGVWTSYAPNPGVTLSNAGKTLTWGNSTGFGRSSLVITNAADSNIPTWWGGGTPPAGYIAPGVSLTHNNRPITGTSLTDATLTVTMTLTPTNPAGPAQNLPTISYDIRFVETPNNPGPGGCAAASPPGNPCNDIFVQVSGFLNDTFDYDGYTYFVNAFPTSGGTLNVLSNAACAAAGLGAGCMGFTTPERQSTSLPFGITISSQPLQVPEPGSLALVGLALAGLGYAGRRRRSA